MLYHFQYWHICFRWRLHFHVYNYSCSIFMLFLSLIPFVFTLFISLLFKIARALVCWTLHDGRRASGKLSGFARAKQFLCWAWKVPHADLFPATQNADCRSGLRTLSAAADFRTVLHTIASSPSNRMRTAAADQSRPQRAAASCVLQTDLPCGHHGMAEEL